MLSLLQGVSKRPRAKHTKHTATTPNSGSDGVLGVLGVRPHTTIGLLALEIPLNGSTANKNKGSLEDNPLCFYLLSNTLDVDRVC